MTSRWNADTRVFSNPDGSVTLQASTAPINYQNAAGVWAPIDNALEYQGGWLVTSANSWTVRIGSWSEGLELSAGGERVSIVGVGGDGRVSPSVTEKPLQPSSPAGLEASALPGPSEASYQKPWSDADVTDTVEANQLDEDVVIDSAQASSTFTFDVSGTDMSLRADGGIDFSGAIAKRFAIAPPRVVTAGGMNVTAASGAAYTVSGEQLTVGLDPSWLAGEPSSAFPITVDPEIQGLYADSVETFASNGDTYCSSGCTYTTAYSSEIAVGTSGGVTWDAAVHIPYESLESEYPGYRVYDAEFQLTTPGSLADPYSACGYDAASACAMAVYDESPSAFSSASYASVSQGKYVQGPWYGFSVEVGGDIDNWITAGLSNQWFGVSDPSASLSYYSASLFTMILELPPQPSRVTNVSSGTVFSTTEPTFDASEIPENTTDTGQLREFDYQLTTGSSPGTGQVFSSGELAQCPSDNPNESGCTDSVPDWQVPLGELSEGVTYYAWVLTNWQDDLAQWPEVAPPGSWGVSFSVKLGLGSGGPSPTDEVGSVPGQSSTPATGAPSPGLPGSQVTVNLVNGNVSFSVSTPVLSTVSGGLSLGFTYNSLPAVAANPVQGLTGTYYNDVELAAVNSDPTTLGSEVEVATRPDPDVEFDWGYGSAVAAQNSSEAYTRWTGTITFPNDDTWLLGDISSDGMDVAYDSTQVLSDWGPHAAQSFPTFGSVQINPPTNSSGQVEAEPIQVDWHHSSEQPAVAELFAEDVTATDAEGTPVVYQVPASWLSHATSILPPGWAFDSDATQASWVGLVDHGSSVTVYEPDGSGYEFINTGGDHYSPPVEDPSAQLSVDSSGNFVLDDPNSSLVYTFDAAGSLVSVESAADTLHRAALDYTYSGSPAVLREITDPVSNNPSSNDRVTYLSYGGDPLCSSGQYQQCCPTPPAGYSASPPGMLCQIHFWDGNSTDLYYSDDELVRIDNPGPVTYQFGYDSDGRLTTEVDPLANEVWAANQRSDCPSSATSVPACSTTITYNSSNQAATVTSPAPDQGGTVANGGQAERAYCYGDLDASITISSGAVNCTNPAVNVTSMAVAGISPTVGYAQQDTYDAQGRITMVRDSTGLATIYTWNAADQLVSTTNPDGTETSSVYDTQGHPTASYGPAPSSSYNADGTPASGQSVPTATTAYDGDFSGLAASWYTNTTTTGTPAFQDTAPTSESWSNGTSPSAGTYNPSLIPSSGFSGNLSGLVTVPSTGKLSFDGDGGQVKIDGHPYIEQMGGPYPAQVEADRPSDWWRLGEASGATVAADQSGGDSGTYEGGVTLGQSASYLADGDSTAAGFNGTTGTVEIPDTSTLEFSDTEPFSIEAWVKTDQSSGEVAIASKMANSSPYQGWELGLYNGEPYLLLINSYPSSFLDVIANTSAATGSWEHIVATYTGSSNASGVTIYINGSAVASTAYANSLTATSVSSAPLYLGSRADSTYFLDGDLADVAAYPNQTLSATQVSAQYSAAGETSVATAGPTIYNYAYPQAVEAATPVAYWRLSDAPSSTTATDSWGSYNGTYYSGSRGQLGAIPGDPDTSTAFSANSSQFVQLPTGMLPGAGVASTVEAWFKTTIFGPIFAYNGGAVGAGTPSAHDTPLYVGLDGKLHGGIWPAVNMVSSATVNDNKWHMAALTDDGNGNLTLYLDGREVASESGADAEIDPDYPPSIAAGYVTSPSWPETPGNEWWYYTGSIQDVALYNQPLYASQIAQQYQAGAFTAWDQGTVTDNALSLWRLSEANTADGALDSIGPNDATYNGAVTFTQTGPMAGDPNTAATFAGSASSPQYVGLPAGILAGAGSPSSIEAWFKTTSAGPIYAYENQTVGSSSAPTATDIPLYVGTDGKLHGGIWGAVTMESSTTVTDGNWHQAVLTDDGNGDLVLYLDGKEVASTTGAGPEAAPGYGESIAAGYANTSWPDTPGDQWWYFNGSIADVALYSSPLSAAQVAEHYQDAQTPPGATSDVHTISVTDQQFDSGGQLDLTTNVAGSSFDPNYGLATQSSDADGDVTATSYGAAGIDPAYGLATAVTENPGGLNLTTTTTYETPGPGSYLRVTAKTLPAGNTTTYLNYCGYATDPECNPSSEQQGAWASACGVSAGADQYGLVAQRSDPAPATGAGNALVEQYLYDQDGRQVGVRDGTVNTISSAGWDCTTYDLEGRVTSQSWPAFNGQAARTVTYSYAVDGNPLVNSVTDTNWTAASISSTVDLLDRVVSYSDIYANTTTTSYNQAGQMTATDGPGGDITYGYNQAGQATTITLNGASTALATSSYNPATGQLSSVADANAVTENLGYNADGIIDSHLISEPASQPTTGETETFSPAGRVTGQDVYVAGQGLINANPSGADYTYDAAGRLTQADLPGATYTYSYSPSTGCPDNNAGENTNRTTLTVTGTAAGTTSYCYDNADRLVSTSSIPSGDITYDAHGNTITEGNQSFTYDASDQLIKTEQPGNLTIYTRDPLDRVAAQTSITPISEIATSSNTATAATSVSLAAPAATQPGDLIVASVTAAAGSYVLPSGWSLVAQQTNGTAITWVADHTAASGDPSSWNFGDSVPTTIVAAAVSYANVGGTPIDTETTAADPASTSQPLPQVTTSGNAETIVHVVGYTGDVTPTAPAGDTTRNSTSTALASQVVSDTYQDTPGTTPAESASTNIATTSQAITIALQPQSSTQRLGYSGQTDTSSFTQNTSGTTIGTSIGLPAGQTYTTTPTTVIWSYTNNHGDTITTTNNTGTITWTGYWGPYGENASGNAPPTDTAITGASYGYNGAQSKLTEGNLILMGARPYSIADGRFIQVDPRDGGCANEYTYAYGDPMNYPDLSGQFSFGHLFHSIGHFFSSHSCGLLEGLSITAAVGAFVLAPVSGGASLALLGVSVAASIGAPLSVGDTAGAAAAATEDAVVLGAGAVASSAFGFARAAAMGRIAAGGLTFFQAANDFVGTRKTCG